jgi:3-hydroxyisobutyrate dehydrogenase-like beta-hydroxyacid dehydrogenase
MKLGFIGLGHIGSAMAANRIRAAHEVTVFNRTPGKNTPLVALGALEATNLAEACRGEVVITMLADDDAVSHIVLGSEGIVGKLSKGAIHLSMSTISVSMSKRLALAHAQSGQRYVAAPVFGRPDRAAAAKLFIVAAGEPGAVDACSDALAQKTTAIGVEPSAANLVKRTAY